MKKIFSLIAAVLLATGLWADVVLEIKTIPSTKGIPASGADNAIFYTRAGGAAKSVTINSVAYLSPSECGFVFTLDSESEIKLNTLRASGTSTWTTCSLYKTPELLQELYGCAMLNNKKLSEELITWKDSADEKNAFYTAVGITAAGDNGCTVDVKKNGAAAVDDVDYSKTNINNYTFLKAGEFVITISQAMDANNHCAVEESVTVTVLDASPVTAVTIDGPAAGVIGQELTYTATAVGATAYEWYLDGNKQGSDSAKFIYTAVKGDHSIVCKARNEFNAEDTWIASDAKEVVVTKVCGELIKVTLTNNKAASMHQHYRQESIQLFRCPRK